MDVLSEKSIQLLYFLLPGFLAAWIFYGLTAHPRREAFDRIVQALIFTFLIKLEVIGLHKLWWAWWHRRHRPASFWTDSHELVWSGIGAVLTGLIVALFANTDWAHWALRKLRVTKRTSYPSEWYSGFRRFEKDVILHLKGDRRVRGHPEEWPDQPDRGHFLLEGIAWVSDAGENFKLSLVERIMIPATDVEMVEFLFDDAEVADVDAVIAQTKAFEQIRESERNADERQDGPEPAGE